MRTLGTINAKPQDAAPVFKEALEKAATGPRVQAAQALGQMIRVANFLRPVQTGLVRAAYTDEKDVIDTIAAVLPANAPGLKDSSPRVRRLFAERPNRRGRLGRPD